MSCLKTHIFGPYNNGNCHCRMHANSNTKEGRIDFDAKMTDLSLSRAVLELKFVFDMLNPLIGLRLFEGVPMEETH